MIRFGKHLHIGILAILMVAILGLTSGPAAALQTCHEIGNQKQSMNADSCCEVHQSDCACPSNPVESAKVTPGSADTSVGAASRCPCVKPSTNDRAPAVDTARVVFVAALTDAVPALFSTEAHPALHPVISTSLPRGSPPALSSPRAPPFQG